MENIVNFEFKRLRYNKLIFLMPITFIIIGVSGVLLSSLFYKDSDTSLKMLNILNAYNQFTYIFFSFIYIYTYGADLKKGIYVFYSQIGYSFKKVLLVKTVILYIISLISTNVTFIFLFILFKNKNIKFLINMLMSLDINLIFILLFSLLLTLYFKNIITATLVCFASFIVFNTLNLVLYGLFNQADPNSISYNAILLSVNGTMEHRSLEKLSLDISEYKYLLTLFPNVIWISILVYGIKKILKRGNKKNEI